MAFDIPVQIIPETAQNAAQRNSGGKFAKNLNRMQTAQNEASVFVYFAKFSETA